MKYCVSNKVGIETMEKADQIKFYASDMKAIPDYYEKYPDKEIILYYGYRDVIDWDELKELHILGRGKLIVAIPYVELLEVAKEKGIRHFYSYPITTFYELNALKKYDVECVKIGIPLFFNMDKVKAVGIPIRAVPNVAYSDGFPRENGVCGQWIRPEDLNGIYADYIESIEFEGVGIDKEELLYRVYAEDHEWRRGLDLIINNLAKEGSNRLILSTVEQRLNCGQACQSGGKCHICERLFNLADIDKVVEYKHALNNPTEETE